MKLSELKKLLSEHSANNIRFALPTGSLIPPHAHVTEIARIEKRFIDCGGTFRAEQLCRLQTWFADDTDHRLTAGKLLNIFQKSGSLFDAEDMDVDVEHEAPFISQFPIATIQVQDGSLIIQLGVKHTDCLAPDKCGVPPKKFSFTPLPTFQPSKCC